jgi:molybdopterin molybdotransferase
MPQPPPSPIEESEALDRILACIPAGDSEELVLEDCAGLYLARDLLARYPSPPFDCSAMDGYALAHTAEGYPAGSTWKILAGEGAAGSPTEHITAGQALRIFTGAPIPEGAGAVAMQEDVDRDPQSPADSLTLRCDYREGEYVRRAGSDLCAGQVLLRRGAPLTPQALSAGASQGLITLPCPPPPRVGILTTGNELVPAGQPLPPGAIHDSNLPLLQGLLRQAHVHLAGTAQCRDERDSLKATAHRLLSQDNCEILISCGGVSVGDHDHIAWLTKELGFTTVLWGVRMKPGKPFLFAAHPHGKWFFGLPGNPASAFVCFHRLVAPALRQRMGAAPELLIPPRIPATLRGNLENRGDRPHHLRGHRDADGFFQAVGLQQSHAIAGLANCNALLHLAPEQTLADGTTITVTPV